jgi:hypothetical protein
MRVIIDSTVLEKEGFTMQDFAIILYYLSGGKGVLNEESCTNLWNRGFLIKDVEGYIIDNNKFATIESWVSASTLISSDKGDLVTLANTLRDLYPVGKKPGTNDYWKDSTKVISQRLAMFFKKYGDKYTNDEIVKATKNYVTSFNGNYQYMRLLKYFIYKRDREAGDETSQLASYLDNANEDNLQNTDWTSNLV